jgi:dTMP kinase
VQRLIHGRGLNYWEAGMDLNLADNLYDSFVLYQTEVIKELEELALEYNFLAIDADRSPREIFEDLQRPIRLLLEDSLPKAERPF